MKAIERFFYVGAPDSDLLHMAIGAQVEGPALCGVYMRKGWITWLKHVSKRKRCDRCVRAIGRRTMIAVQRVRKAA